MSSTNPLDYSRPLDMWVWSNKPEIKAASKYIFTLLQKKQRLTTYSPKRLKNHLKVILTDLFVAHKESPHLYIGFSRAMRDYTPLSRNSKLYLNPKYVAFLTDFLSQEGYIELHLGIHYEHFSRVSRMKATQKLLRYFRRHRADSGIILNLRPEIIVRDKNRKDMPFDIENIEIKNMLRNVRKINSYLKTYRISLDWLAFASDCADYYYDYSLTPRHKKYTRIFNNNSLEQGGRFYGHWTQFLRKQCRKHITIAGSEVVELDYSCLHITMLYGIEKHIPPTGDLYNLIGIDGIHRNIIKDAFNIAINSSNELSAIKAIYQKQREQEQIDGVVSPKPKDILNAIKITHPLLVKYLCSGYGLYLQKIDSDIAEQVMLNLFSQGICVLSIHDSFIVSAKYRDKLYTEMKDVFYSRFSFYPIIK